MNNMDKVYLLANLLQKAKLSNQSLLINLRKLKRISRFWSYKEVGTPKACASIVMLSKQRNASCVNFNSSGTISLFGRAYWTMGKEVRK